MQNNFILLIDLRKMFFIQRKFFYLIAIFENIE